MVVIVFGAKPRVPLPMGGFANLETMDAECLGIGYNRIRYGYTDR